MTCMCGDTACPSCGLAKGTLEEHYDPVPLTPGKTVKTRYVYSGPILAREYPEEEDSQS